MLYFYHKSGAGIAIGIVLLYLLCIGVESVRVSPSHILVLGEQGHSCEVACAVQGRQCSQGVPTAAEVADGTLVGSLKSLLGKEGSSCTFTEGQNATSHWPGVQVDENGLTCIGWKQTPSSLSCNGKTQKLRRLCRCAGDNTEAQFFGTGCSGCSVGTTEETIFFHSIQNTNGDYGLMTHFWSTAPADTEGQIIIRYYVDGEVNASIEFNPSMASGVGFDDDSQAPWGTKWLGLGAGKNGDQAWFNNFRVPFWSNITVTAQTTNPTYGFYIIVRGGLNVPFGVGIANQLQPGTKLVLHKFNQTVDPLTWVPVVNITSGKGFFFMHTISVQSGNLNFLEGCYHAFSPVTQDFPGTVLSTGTEDFFDSGWYFNAGPFHMPVSGFTHEFIPNSTYLTWSAYRFHDMDPLQFNDGFALMWRNGDETDPHTGEKCYTLSGGNVVGAPTKSQVQIYAWVYQWN